MPQGPFSSAEEAYCHNVTYRNDHSFQQFMLERRLARYCVLLEAVRRLSAVDKTQKEGLCEDDPPPTTHSEDEDDASLMTYSEDEDNDTTSDDLKAFLDCLAEVCSFDRKSYMVTAILVEETGEGPVFHITRNSLAHDNEEQTLVAFLEELLRRIGSLQEDTLLEFKQSPAFEDLLSYVVMDNVPRIKCYQSGIRRALSECMEHESKDALSSALRREIEILNEAATMSLSSRNTDGVLELISVAENFAALKSEFREALTPSAVVRTQLPSRWEHVFHNSSRLRSYKRNMSKFFLARRIFGGLFQNFKVHFLRPETPVPTFFDHLWSVGRLRQHFSKKPFNKKPLADNFVEKFREEMQRLCDEGFVRQVHAEVALSHWFHHTRGFHEMSPDDRAGAFFGRFRYVACSKPCCFLCSNYFFGYEETALNIKCRDDHQNVLPPRWALPGFKLCTTDKARIAHLETYRGMTSLVRMLVMDIVTGSKEQSDYDAFDSGSELSG